LKGKFSWAALGLWLGCVWAAPGLWLGCVWAALGVWLGCAWAAPPFRFVHNNLFDFSVQKFFFIPL